VVLTRVSYTTAGLVLGTQTISGPPMLALFLNNQIQYWTLRTEAAGEERCQSVFIVSFKLTYSEPQQSTFDCSLGSLCRINIQGRVFATHDEAAYRSHSERVKTAVLRSFRRHSLE
jgi:hypothetical protein